MRSISMNHILGNPYTFFDSPLFPPLYGIERGDVEIGVLAKSLFFSSKWNCHKKVDTWLRVIMQLVSVLVFVRLVPGSDSLMPSASVFDYTRSR